MRVIALVVLVGLAGCAMHERAVEAEVAQLNAYWAQRRAVDEQEAKREAALPAEERERLERTRREKAALDARNQQAVAICNARGDMARATYPDRSLLGLDAIFAGNQARAICWNLYQQTGVTPNF
jgi:hypothetical protein